MNVLIIEYCISYINIYYICMYYMLRKLWN